MTGKTAAELITKRSNPRKPYMGLTSWKGAKVRKGDVAIAKNYLNEKEITQLNRIVVMYLDYAEDLAGRGKTITMEQWADKLDAFLETWCRNKATQHFADVLNECWVDFEKHGISKPTLKVVRMKRRWGSLNKNATLSLNLALIRAPRECIEYVVIHELCHLLYHNHGPEFQRLLVRPLPDWVKRKHKLEMALCTELVFQRE